VHVAAMATKRTRVAIAEQQKKTKSVVIPDGKPISRLFQIETDGYSRNAVQNSSHCVHMNCQRNLF
jgi:hypothetical protein